MTRCFRSPIQTKENLGKKKLETQGAASRDKIEEVSLIHIQLQENIEEVIEIHFKEISFSK